MGATEHLFALSVIFNSFHFDWVVDFMNIRSAMSRIDSYAVRAGETVPYKRSYKRWGSLGSRHHLFCFHRFCFHRLAIA